MKKDLKYALDLQYFAENPEEPEGKPEDKTPEEPTFEDILASNPSYKKAFEAELAAQRVQLEAIAEQKSQEQLSAAEKLAKMTEEERRIAELEAREKAAEEREREIELAELKAEAVKLVTTEGLPVELAELVNYTSADTVKESVNHMKSAFDAAVSARVKEIAKGTTVPGAAKAPAKPDAMAARNKKYEDRYGL